MSAPNRPTLPSYSVVLRWKEEHVIKWLKKFQLDDCIPAFQSRHIDGPALLELTEDKLIAFQDIKIKRRGQLSKYVNECKTQASNAKRLVGNIKTSQKQVDMNEYQDAGVLEDSDGWDTDFDDDDDDEEQVEEGQSSSLPTDQIKDTSTEFQREQVKDEQESLQSVEPNNNHIKTDDEDQVQTATASPVFNHVLSESTKPKPSERALPKPPPIKPLISSLNRNNIPRPPIKRPPSQPPPPPLPQPPTLQTWEGPQEDYEIPINSSAGAGIPQANLAFSSSSSFLSSSSLSSNTDISTVENSEDNQETYEIIEPPEENYEIVETSSVGERPALPPRIQGAQFMSPPPLPEKPVKIQDSVSQPSTLYRKDIGTSNTRPWLSRSALLNSFKDGSLENLTQSTSENNLGGLNSLHISRNHRKTSLPVVPPKLDRNIGSNADTISIASTTDSHSSRSSTPDKAVIEQPISSLHVSSLGNSNEGIKMPPPPLPVRVSPMLPDIVAQNIANRPLPPVPSISVGTNGQTEEDLYNRPWFHDIERQVAEEQVKKLALNGGYLVRPSKRAGQENPYTLTVLHENKVFHLNIRLRPEGIYALGREKPREKTFPSVTDLITFHQTEAILLTSRGEPAGKTNLRLHPKKE